MDKDFVRLTSQLKSVISLFRARLVTLDMINDPESLDQLEKLNASIKYLVSPRVAWMCYRIVDETIKRLFLKKVSESFMPVDLTLLTDIRLKPSPLLLNSLTPTMFDT